MVGGLFVQFSDGLKWLRRHGSTCVVCFLDWAIAVEFCV